MNIARGGFTVLLDLDNTLIDSASMIYPHIEARMRQYLLRTELASPELVAATLTRAREEGQGVTVVGLRERFSTFDAADFLSFTHPPGLLSSVLTKGHRLRTLLARKPSIYVIASDGPYAYCAEAVRALGISRWISEIVSIDRVNFIPKARRRYWPEVTQLFGLEAQRCILLDDRRDCLTNAVRYGAKAVRIHRPSGIPVNYRA